MKIKGEGVYIDSTGVLHEVKGKGVLPDDIVLQSLNVSGKLEFGKISCDKVSVKGKCEGGSLIAKSISVKGKMDVDSVEAEELVIESHSGTIGAVKCKSLKIFSHTSTATEEIFEKFIGSKLFDDDDILIGNNDSRVQIKNIDANKVELENCEVEVVRCKDAVIGTNCTIGKVFVAGEYKVADDSTVGETIHN